MIESRLRRGGLVLVAVAGCLAAGLWAQQVLRAEDSAAEKKSPLQQFMHRKMDASSEILEGLVMENAALIKQGGNTLLEMSKAEKFQVLTDKEYRLHNRQFREAVQRVVDAAEKDGYDRAALAWFDVTISCIDCHDHVRMAPPEKNAAPSRN